MSLLDPVQRDYAIKTIYGEDPGLSAEAVANVIRNRVEAGRYGGGDVQGVVLAKNQFEPWNNAKARARMEGLSPDSPEYQRIGGIVDSVFSGQSPDITNGATHFYAPKAQAALGRAVPKWAQGDGQQIGPHVFFAPEGAVTRQGQPQAAAQQGMLAPQPAPRPQQAQGVIAPQQAPAQSGGLLAPQDTGQQQMPMPQMKPLEHLPIFFAPPKKAGFAFRGYRS
jgi:hypothetical protein